jgi:hypothetical protein
VPGSEEQMRVSGSQEQRLPGNVREWPIASASTLVRSGGGDGRALTVVLPPN